MWENRHAGANYVATHGLPRTGLKTRDELYRAWAIREAEARRNARGTWTRDLQELCDE
jgi:acrylyl-CoA reductase (NADPH)/3-hydroxypropionyl-CoA dehydratase/3-hydroxypropionyl-CoA synthetase